MNASRVKNTPLRLLEMAVIFLVLSALSRLFVTFLHDSDRVFYETLIEQNPNSEMAQEWCLLYGILPFERANALNMVVCKRKGKPVLSIASPAKGSNKPQQGAKSANVKPASAAASNNKRRKVVDDLDVVGDSGLGPSNDWEGVGSSGL